MSVRMPGTAEAPAQPRAPRPPLVIATPIGSEAEAGLQRVSWLRTTLRLAAMPEVHPWSARWKLTSAPQLWTAFGAVILLVLMALSGCASVPAESLVQSTALPRNARGARCESLLASREVQVPASGEVADVRVTIREIPEVTGKLRLLVRRPRFPSNLRLEPGGPAAFDQVIELAAAPGQRSITLVLQRPDGASRDWPRKACTSCSIDVELTGLFGAFEGFDALLAQADQDVAAIDADFASQSSAPVSRPGAAVHDGAASLIFEANRCGVSLEAPLRTLQAAIERLDWARAHFYAGPSPELPDAKAVIAAWNGAADAVLSEPVLASVAKARHWPPTLSPRRARRLVAAARHLELAAQAEAFGPEAKAVAARWIAVALAPDAATLEKNIAGLPKVRDLAEAEARLAWVDPKAGERVPVPGVTPAAYFTPREYKVARRGRRCIGVGGAAPVNDPVAESKSVASLLGVDGDRLKVGRGAEVAAAREKLGRAKKLLCDPPAMNLDAAFAGLEDKDLGPVAERLDSLFRAIDQGDDGKALKRTAQSRTNDLLCKLFAPAHLQRKVQSVEGYKVFVQGGTHLLELLPDLLVCESRVVPAREVRARFAAVWRTALEKHGLVNRLCSQRAGRCPTEIAASVQQIFGLHAPALASPGRGNALDFPPAFGFGELWVDKLDHCDAAACEALTRLGQEAPAGHFDGAVCKPRAPGVAQLLEVRLDRPEVPTSLAMTSCDAREGVHLTLRRTQNAGTLVAIASPQRFRYGSEQVTREGHHPQLGHIFERVADLSDPSDVARRPDDSFDVALTPTVANQVFYFFSLHRRDY